MALWKDSNPAPAGGITPNVSTPPPKDTFTAPADRTNVAPLNPQPAARKAAEMKESVIASDLTIEGKIVGSGHVRIAGRFKGDVHVDGNLSIDTGANLDGQVKAHVIIGSRRAARQHRERQAGRVAGRRRHHGRREGRLPHRGCRLAHARPGGIRLGG